MKTLKLEQGSDEWFQARLGKPTGSGFSKIITPDKGDKSKSYTTYLHELIAERLIRDREVTFKSEWMDRGNELEPFARSAYEFIHEVDVEQIGFILNDKETIGVSPDGLIGNIGGLEIKCPKASTLVKWVLDDRLPLEYKPQVMGCLWVSEREWWDFIGYHPSMNLFIKRIYRDEDYIKKMSQHITDFTDELEEKYQRFLNG